MRKLPTYRADIPVLCVGNLTAGGAGKTPTVLALVGQLEKLGKRPVILTRGYGGSMRGPLVVDPDVHRADDVGDEALLLVREAPTIVAADRTAGARLAQHQNADIIVMDDGFQNPALAKSRSLVVVDGQYGLGNGYVIPAGPMRAPLAAQIEQTDAVLIIGSGRWEQRLRSLCEQLAVPVFQADLVPREDVSWLKGQQVIAFTGIAHPDKFFKTLEGAGGKACRLRGLSGSSFLHDEGSSRAVREIPQAWGHARNNAKRSGQIGRRPRAVGRLKKSKPSGSSDTSFPYARRHQCVACWRGRGLIPIPPWASRKAFAAQRLTTSQPNCSAHGTLIGGLFLRDQMSWLMHQKT